MRVSKLLHYVAAVVVTGGVLAFAPAQQALAGPPPGVSPRGSATQQAVCEGIGDCSTSTSGTSLTTTVNFIVNLLLVLLGAISVIMIIIGGIKYTTSAGDSNAVSSAKNTIIYALVGLALAALAKPIVFLVLRTLNK